MSGAEAANKQPQCGDTITADTTLDSDLVDCPNNGIVIGADDITLDLNGHRIDGDGAPAAGCDPATEFCDVGVANDRHDGVTMMDGSIRQFGGGVSIFGKARDNRLLGHFRVGEPICRHSALQSLPQPGEKQLRKRLLQP